eukprot:472238-Pelagomonas_calceolata.AAC.12
MGELSRGLLGTQSDSRGVTETTFFPSGACPTVTGTLAPTGSGLGGLGGAGADLDDPVSVALQWGITACLGAGGTTTERSRSAGLCAPARLYSILDDV